MPTSSPATGTLFVWEDSDIGLPLTVTPRARPDQEPAPCRLGDERPSLELVTQEWYKASGPPSHSSEGK